MTESLRAVPYWWLAIPLFWGSLAVFALELRRHLRVLAVASRVSPHRDRRRRVGALVRYAFLQTRLLRDPAVGLMHLAIFAAFLLLSTGAANAATGGVVEAAVAWPFQGVLWAMLLFLRNVAAVAALVALGFALTRRLVLRPARLTLSASSLAILLLIAVIVAADLVTLTFEAALNGPLPGAALTDAFARSLDGMDAGLRRLFLSVGFWGHVGGVCLFLVWLPATKHLHIATSFFNVYFRKLEPRGALPSMDLEAEGDPFGIGHVADLSWKDLLDGLTCTECGRCQEACPAYATGKALNPKAFVMGIRELTKAAEAGLGLLPDPHSVHLPGVDRSDSLRATAARIAVVPGAISDEAVWDCLTCGACMEACPVLIEHVDKIVGVRRNLVLEEARFPEQLGRVFRALETSGNPWGLPAAARLDWTEGLPFSVPVAADLQLQGRLNEIEVLYWVGCAAAFDDRIARTARAFAGCLNAAGVRYAVLGTEERCTGDAARRLGNEYLFQTLAAHNIETLSKYAPPEIVTTCPHCLNTLANEYGQLGGRYKVTHHSVYLQRLVSDGRLPIDRAGRSSIGAATFHDSCYLARYNGVVDAPRDLLKFALGLTMVEMPSHGLQTACCGAGGGRMWLEESKGTRINAARARQAIDTGAAVVATACPFCMTMLGDGLADSRSADQVSCRDISEMVFDFLGTAVSGRNVEFVGEAK